MTEAQSPDVEKRYIITAELLKELGRWDLTFNKMREIQNKIVSCPYDPDALKAEERERVLKKLVEKIDSCILSCPEDANMTEISEATLKELVDEIERRKDPEKNEWDPRYIDVHAIMHGVFCLIMVAFLFGFVIGDAAGYHQALIGIIAGTVI